MWVYCPGHAGVTGNDRADRLAGKATLTSGLLLGRSEVLKSLKHYLRAQSQRHHNTNRLEECGVERGSAGQASLKGRERAIVNQTNVGRVSKATLGKLLRDGVERIIIDFSECADISSTELHRIITLQLRQKQTRVGTSEHYWLEVLSLNR